MNPRMPIKGRGSHIRPANRFESIQIDDDWEHLELAGDVADAGTHARTLYFADESQSILAENTSPDIPFRYSLNPYRGCVHGCAYCYARPTHEYFGLSAGLDFETKIFIKQRAPGLFRDVLASGKWVPEPIMFSGVTDCYQPAERSFRLTRGCLQVACTARQPITIITKNALVTRDLDILADMARHNVVSVAFSLTTLNADLAGQMEPRTSRPAARLRAISELRERGVPVNVVIAPVIPGLNDVEIPTLLKAAKEAGAMTAGFILLRLPLTVVPVFQEWLERAQTTHKDRILSRIRQTRGGKLYVAQFGERLRGRGEVAKQIEQTFRVFAGKLGLDAKPTQLDTTQFRPPPDSAGQRRLF